MKSSIALLVIASEENFRDERLAKLSYDNSAGDRIVRLAGREVHNVYDYTYALGEMKAGQEYEMEIIRGSEHLKLKITPAARR